MTASPLPVPDIALNDGTSIPQLGFGVFLVEPGQTQETVEIALETGYRHLDTAQMYGNEREVGAAIAASGIPRDELYVTTKLNNDNHLPDDARRSLTESLDKLGLGRVDLFLIHWPLPTRYDGDFASTWRTMVELRESGGTTSVGVSNFEPEHLDRILDEVGVVPAVNQIEVNPYFTNEAARAADARHGIATEAWSPIARGRIAGDATIEGIARRVERTPAQVVLRWHLQRGDIIFPKSTHRERIEENAALFDFELSDDDLAGIAALDRGATGRTGPNPTTFTGR
ncbi:MAG TPA: aldo/keto reductase [Nocardioides sp.]|jgi:2,5-diketo-D-gluconate reductase A|uniref:aldo/keto reductase n=1 Tax=Nocardioides sp. TaxID=35761 RepID=UPI002E3615B2|nr:aldo/keto reductase [Nocardioides sp.]HEX3932018.1 aldo/keto reductase [Nocardioides sp.]